HLDDAGDAIHFNFGYHRNVGGHGLVARIADAAAAPAVALLARFPGGGPGYGLEHGALALVLDMCEAERHRVDAGRGRELVHEGLDREYVGIGAERAQRRGPHRIVHDQVVRGALAREIVERDGVAVAGTVRLRGLARRPGPLRIGDVPAPEQVDTVCIARPLVVALAPDVEGPVDYSTAGDGALDLHGHGRAVGLPLELVVTHPLQSHRPPIDRARQHRGVEGDVVGAVVTVAAGAFGVDAADVARFETERPREGGTQREDALAMGPDRKLAVLELGHRAGGRDRGVRLIRPMVCRLDHLGARRHGRVLLADHSVLAAQGHELLVHLRRVGQLGAARPLSGCDQHQPRIDGLLLALRHHAEKAAVTHHRDDARHRPDFGLVEAVEPGAIAWRPHHAAMHHAGKPHVLHEGGAPRHLARDVAARNAAADYRVLRGRLRLRPGRGLALQVRFACELPVADRACAAHRSIRYGQIGDGDTELRSRQVQQDRSRLGAREAQRRAAVLDRQAAGGLPLIRGPTGVGRDHLDAHVRDVELLGRYLRKRGQDALAELAFAGEHRDRARGVDADPAVQHAVRVEAAG